MIRALRSNRVIGDSGAVEKNCFASRSRDQFLVALLSPHVIPALARAARSHEIRAFFSLSILPKQEVAVRRDKKTPLDTYTPTMQILLPF